MSTETPNLALPFLAAGQAQKHVTHNDALRMLDAIVQIGVLDRDLSAPPSAPEDGARYLVAASPTGTWSGQEGRIAVWQDGGWEFYAPRAGWLAWIADEQRLLVHDGTGWTGALGQGPLQNLALLGVNATADGGNRLAAKSDAVLFSHDDITPGTGDVRLKLNKSATARTASVLFQTAWSGRAELGTTGDDRFTLKVSSNGTSWSEALQIDNATGNLGLGTAPTNVRLELGTGSFRAAAGVFDRPAGLGSEFYYQRGGVSRWNFGMSNAAESGANAGSDFYVNRFADNGTYLGTPINIARATGALNLFGDARSFGIRPATDNTYALGTAAARWSQIWAANGVIQTSDARDKTDIEPLSPEIAARLVDAVDPVTFRWREGGRRTSGLDPKTGEPLTTAQPGRRRHAGFLAQELRTAIVKEGLDIAAWGLDDPANPESRQWLRPDQLVSILWSALRQTRLELNERSNP
jgi:hypothetical protein